MTSLVSIPLEEITLDQIEPLLEEETARYARIYRWDFQPTAQLVRQLVAVHSLSGVALVDDQQLAGYSYFVLEDHKALIGNAFVGRAWDSPAAEQQLLRSTLAALRHHPRARRVESQPMMLRYAHSDAGAHRFERLFLELDLDAAHWTPPPTSLGPLRLEPWHWRYEDHTANLIFRAYSQHIDARINDQYLSPARTRNYLANLLRYPSCGDFCPASSFLLRNQSDGHVVGASLTSRCRIAGSGIGHISQLCLAPEQRGLGLGRLLLQASLARFCELSCETATLTVTSANAGPLALYQSLGFTERTRLSAYVWPDGPR